MLKELHLTEGRNTGFKKILTALEHNGSPKPEFETDDARSYFISRFYLHPKFNADSISDSSGGTNGANGTNLTPNEQLVLTYLKKHTEDSTKKIAENLPLSLRTIQRCINSLKEKGIIDYQGSRKNGKWIILKQQN